jgi:hypothetical protein
MKWCGNEKGRNQKPGHGRVFDFCLFRLGLWEPLNGQALVLLGGDLLKNGRQLGGDLRIIRHGILPGFGVGFYTGCRLRFV